MSGLPMHVQLSTSRESCRHHCGVHRRPAVAIETERDEEQGINYLGYCFPIKDLGEAGFDLGCHITRDRDSGTMNSTSTATCGP